MQNRLMQLDFLRGVAILLVLCRHQNLFVFTSTMGWIGVDLFFVLSGFLVSGILFKEFLKFGVINPKLFLIRRGFKIYPIYYIFYFFYFYRTISTFGLSFKGLLSELFFIQNYTLNWGYAFGPGWTLALEEQFYFGFAFFLNFAINKKLITLQQHKNSKLSVFEKLLFFILLLCLLFRYAANYYYPLSLIKNTTMTHLRIDSLLAGVLVGYWYYFKKKKLLIFFNKYKKSFPIMIILLLSFTPFIDFLNSFFVRTIGFTMVYLAFILLLIYFLCVSNINIILNKIFSKNIVTFVSKIGIASYSIYIIHMLVNYHFLKLESIFLSKNLSTPFPFFITSFFSITIGIFITKYIEKYFLDLREKHYPSK